MLEIYASDGTTQIGSNDDGNGNGLSRVVMALNPGSYYVRVRHFSGGGGDPTFVFRLFAR